MSSWSLTASRTGSLTRISPPSACAGHPRRHRDVAAEQIVAAPHRLAHVDADADPNTVGPLTKCALHVDTAPHRLLGLREGDHEPVALALHDVTGVLLDVAADHLVVTADQPDPRPVADALVERRRLLDVGEQDRHLAARGEPGQIGPLHLGPVGEILDRRPDRGAQAVLAQDVGGLPDRLDGLAATGEQHVSGVDPAAQLVQLATAAGQQHRHHDECDGLDRGDARKHVERAICAPITAQVLDAEPVMPAKAPYYESRFIRANHPDRPQALWLRETLLLPTAGDPVADVWVMVFDPDGAGNRALKQPYPIEAADYEYDNWTARIGATTIDDRSAQGVVTGRKPLGALGSADHTGRRGRRQTAHRPRVQGALPDGQDDGAPSAGAVRRPARARRRPPRRRRLDRQRQPQLGHDGTPRPTRSARCAVSTTHPNRAWRSSPRTRPSGR